MLHDPASLNTARIHIQLQRVSENALRLSYWRSNTSKSSEKILTCPARIVSVSAWSFGLKLRSHALEIPNRRFRCNNVHYNTACTMFLWCIIATIATIATIANICHPSKSRSTCDDNVTQQICQRSTGTSSVRPLPRKAAWQKGTRTETVMREHANVTLGYAEVCCQRNDTNKIKILNKHNT